jgi:DUF1365 family protein
VSSYIDGGHDVGHASVEEYFAARDFHVDQAAILLLEFPELLGCFAELSTRFCNISLNKMRNVLAGTNVQNSHRKEFFWRISIMTHCRIVDGRKSESADIEDPHGSRIMIEVKAIQGV